MSDEELALEQEGVSEGGAEEPSEEELSEEEKAMARLKEAISVEKEEIGALRLKLTITVPQELLDERRQEEFAELKREALVPGFRKGRAPLPLVEKRFATDVGEQLKTQLIGNGYLAAVEKEDLKTLGDPLFRVKVEEEQQDPDRGTRKVETEKLLSIQEALDHLRLPREGSLTFTCEVELRPQFELPELKKIPVSRPEVSITDEDVDIELTRMRMMRGTFQPVEDGPVKPDDMLYADMKMSVEGQVIATEENLDLAARDIRLRGVPLKGFGAAVEGKNPGDEVVFEAVVPDDHDRVDLRGKTVRFEFTLREIKRLELPPLDEAFLSGVGIDSADELRSAIRSSMEARLAATMRDAMREQIGRYLVDRTKMEIPESLSQRQTERTIARRIIELYQMGLPDAEISKKADELRAGAREQVLRDLKLFFILEKIAEERNIEVSEEQMNSAIAVIAQRSNKRFDRVRDELRKGDGLMTLYMQLRDRMVLDELLADAEITETAGPQAEPPAAADEESTIEETEREKK